MIQTNQVFGLRIVGIALFALAGGAKNTLAAPLISPPVSASENYTCLKCPFEKTRKKLQTAIGSRRVPDKSVKAAEPAKLTYQGPELDEKDEQSLSGNPGATDILTGTGWLGRQLGLTEDTGIRLGGLWIGNTDIQMSGRLPGSASFNSLGTLDLILNMKTIAGIQGGSFSMVFLQFDGQPSNERAGVLTGYNGLTGLAPLNRSELYQMWWRQKLFDENLIIRVGKSVPTADFNNVSRSLPIRNAKPFVAAITSLLFTPIFINPTMIGVMPGYYNSAWGLTLTATPTASSHLSYGIYDGSLAYGRQTGTHVWPTFNSYYFNIGEAATSWGGNYPGKVTVGGWGQSGPMESTQYTESGAQGFFAHAANRLTTLKFEETYGALLGYLQYGINNSRTMIVNQYVGGGITAINILPMRAKDSMGFGVGVSWLNNPPRGEATEVLTQFYYQAHLIGDTFLQPTFSYIPNPGVKNEMGGSFPSATSIIFQLTTLF